MRERRTVQGRKVVKTPLLFPAYAFVLIQMQWHAARWAPGVVRLIMDGLAPAVVPPAVIDDIRSRERGGLIELPKPPPARPGDAVRILRGPFEGRWRSTPTCAHARGSRCCCRCLAAGNA